MYYGLLQDKDSQIQYPERTAGGLLSAGMVHGRLTRDWVQTNLGGDEIRLPAGLHHPQ